MCIVFGLLLGGGVHRIPLASKDSSEAPSKSDDCFWACPIRHTPTKYKYTALCHARTVRSPSGHSPFVAHRSTRPPRAVRRFRDPNGPIDLRLPVEQCGACWTGRKGESRRSQSIHGGRTGWSGPCADAQNRETGRPNSSAVATSSISHFMLRIRRSLPCDDGLWTTTPGLSHTRAP